MHPYRVAALEPRSFPPGPQPGPFRISKAGAYAPRVRGPISRLRGSVAVADGIPPTPSSPAVPPSAVATETDMDTRSRPGQALPGRDRSGLWLRNAAVGLCALAAAAAAVSFTAQYRMVDATRRLPAVAALEAAIPDAAALVFACLGVALALHGRRAIRARALNLAAVGASVFMNAIAAAPGWRNLAIWAMPPIAYALASDTLIAVVRAWVIARHRELNAALAADEATPLTVVGGLILWLLRLAVAPASTLAGFRAWVLDECPVAPGRRALHPAPPRPPAPSPLAAGGEGPARDQDRALPESDCRTTWPSRLDPDRRRGAAGVHRGPGGRPEHRRRPHRPT